MSFVRWHYRNGCYVRSHFRRARRTVAGNGALLFPLTCSDEVTGAQLGAEGGRVPVGPHGADLAAVVDLEDVDAIEADPVAVAGTSA